MKRAVTFGLAGLAGVALVYGAWEWTRHLGRKSILKIAHERSLCESSSSCDAGLRVVTARVGREFGLSLEMVEFCVGVDSWAETRVHRGGWVKSLLVSAIYMPCGRLAESG
jgi:hypothetical protein